MNSRKTILKVSIYFFQMLFLTALMGTLVSAVDPLTLQRNQTWLDSQSVNTVCGSGVHNIVSV